MKASQYSEQVQLIAFVLQKGESWNPEVVEALEKTWGPIRHRGKLFAFDRTGYYEPEMGKDLYRGVVSFEKTIPAETIAQEKERSNALELSLAASQSARNVNIDIGYMDLDKVVLPSYKRGPYKLYAGRGVWLDMLLTYSKGVFHPTQWAFEDFVRNPYQHDLQLIREKFKKAGLVINA
ncbi:DUF4416 family protein [Fibrobacter sp.]|uniref:DUF4416 family protein n=1 Tax=Fibrobacter sp. TaxID=35828 RepID=UPI001B14E96A|nr:DUF4416 family protein [Fibrobacter sp.]MBO7061929.1 DUF4416 family protein [Fibrobacter sp.]